MAVVSKKSNLVTDRAAGIPNADPELVRGNLVVSTGKVSNEATDSAGSQYHLIDIPSHAILHAGTKLKVSGWGFAQVSIGTRTDVDALVSVAKAAGAVVAPVDFGGAGHGKAAWQVLGLSEEPKSGMVSLFAHAIAGATGAGELLFEIHYLDRV